MAFSRRARVGAWAAPLVPVLAVACFPSLDFPANVAPADAGTADATTAPDRDAARVEDARPPSDGGVGGDATPRDAAFPTTPILDSFNRPDSAALDNGWDFYQVGIANGAAVFKPTPADPSGGVARWGEGFGANQEVFATIKRFATASGGEIGLFAKYANDSFQGNCQSWDYYVYLSLNISTGGYVETCKPTDAGGARERMNISVPWADGDQAGLRVRSDNRAEVYRNGVRVAEVSLGTFPFANTGGRIGFGFARAGDAVVDDFGGGTTPPP